MMLILTAALLISLILMFQYITLKRDIKELKKQLQYTDKTGSHFQYFSVSTDHDMQQIINVLNELKDKNQKVQYQALQMDMNLKEMISNISHDIRTPLTSIYGYIQLLEECKDDEKAQYYQIIKQRLDYLNTLLEELFLYTKLVNGSVEFTLSEVNVYDLLCQTLLPFHNQFEEKNIHLDIVFEDVNCWIESDELYLKRIFNNLINNVLMHGMDKLTITQRVYHDFVYIQFRNNVKNSNVKVEQLFQRFYTGDQSRNKQGSGLGLAIVKELVEGLEGSVDASLNERELLLDLYLLKNISNNEFVKYRRRRS